MTMTGPATPVDLIRHVSRPRAGLNILFLCHRVPYPPDKGEKIRAYHLIRGLARRHKVHLLTLSDGAVPDLAPLEEICERVEVFPLSRPAAYVRAALRVLRPGPLTLSFFESEELAKRLKELAQSERFDVMAVFSSAMAPYAALLPDVPGVLDMVDVDSAKWAQYARFAPLPLRPVYALEARRLRRYEASLASRFQRITLATANEVRLYKSFAPSTAGARMETVLSGVDFDFFQPMDLPKSPHPSLVFTGQMDYFANVDGVVHFARQVFPRLRQRFPDLEFVVVGRAPVPAVRELGELPGIQVTGAVGDVRPFLARAWAFVAPLRIAQGVQNKVLEAMASDLPVVASERVLAGLSDGGFRNGRDLLAASTDEEMERAVASLIEDAAARERLAECARQRLVATYRWAPNLDHFEELLGASARPPAGSPLPREAGEEGEPVTLETGEARRA